VMRRWRCRHVIRLAFRAPLAGGIRRGAIFITVRAAGTLSLLTFRELLVCLREKEESIGGGAGSVIGCIGVP
jgi:hypothetical protein